MGSGLLWTVCSSWWCQFESKVCPNICGDSISCINIIISVPPSIEASLWSEEERGRISIVVGYLLAQSPSISSPATGGHTNTLYCWCGAAYMISDSV